jgi:Sulfotransferase domain
MQLIGAGLPRTATTTQKVALETLGFAPCYHMRDMMADLDKGVRLWRSAYDGDEPWGEVFGEARSTVDWPSAFHWRELMDAYPEAKVLLSVRDHESWARSMQDTICQIYFGDSLLHHLAQARYHVDPAWKGWVDLMIDTFWSGRGPFADTRGDSTQMIEKAERWNQEVQATVPGDRLLVWEPKDGWQPLCEFLGVDVPAEELPKVNDTEAFRDGIMGAGVASLDGWWAQRQAA